MEADTKPTCAEVRPFECLLPQIQGKEEPVMDREVTPRSVALRNKQITENDILLLARKAKEMIEQGTLPPEPVKKAREGKRVRVKN